MDITEWNNEEAKEVWQEEKAMEIARKLLNLNLTIEEIAMATGLSRNEIESLG